MSNIKYEVSYDDRALIKRLYGLNEKEATEAFRIYYRKPMSICAAAKSVANRRKNDKFTDTYRRADRQYCSALY